MRKSCVIIGGGIGGLFTGAFLAKNGIKVTVLEKNQIIGGGLQCFTRNGKVYETGMHVAGGFEPGGSLYKICKYLGFFDQLDIHHISPERMDEIYYHSTGERFVISSGKEGFVNSLSAYFPEEKNGLQQYADELFKLTDDVPLFSLKKQPENVHLHSPNFLMPADEFIALYIKDPKLREILAYLNPLYGGEIGHTPAYIHALLNVLYIKGASRFAGGSQQLADALKNVIEENGGEVLSNSEVEEINVSNKHVNYVVTKDGRKFTADYYVSSIHPVEMVKRTPGGTFRKSLVERINQIPNSTSAFSLYIDLKPGMFPYIDHTCYYMEEFGKMWEQDKTNVENWPSGFMYMTPPDKNQGEYAGRLLVHCVMNFDEVRKWEDSKVGHRGAEYEKWKLKRANQIINKLSNLYPDLPDQIERVYAASPLTIRDYYNTKEGSIFGYKKDCKNLIYSQLSVKTKVDNLLLTGQNVILHGICGVPLTAIITAEGILGKNFLINKINNHHES